MVNYKILSPSLDLLRYSPSHTTIPAGSIKSMQQTFLITETSWPGHLSKPSSPYIAKGPDGEIYAIRRTSGNIFVARDYSRYGDFSPQIDDLSIGSWKATGENPQTREYVKLPCQSSWHGVIESFGERKATFPYGDTSLPKYVTDSWVVGVRNNDVGKELHRIENLRQSLARYYRSKDGQEFVAHLKSLGLSLEEIGYLASGLLPEETIYGITRTNDGKVILKAGRDPYDKISKEARFWGVDVEDLRNLKLNEEQGHNARRSYDKVRSLSGLIREEIATKTMERDYYLSQAKGAEGNPKLVREYLKRAQIVQHDIDTTVERYSDISAPDDLESRVNSVEAGHSAPIYARTNGKIVYLTERTAKATTKDGEDTRAEESSEGTNGRVVSISAYRNRRNAETDAKSTQRAETKETAKSEPAEASEAPTETAEAA